MDMMAQCKICFFILLSVFLYCVDCVYVQTRDGWVRGRITSEAIAFLGIPYASPPRRWEYARPARPWSGRIWDATRVRPMCIQEPCAASDPPGVCLRQMSEDCLYLNVYVPPDAEPGGNKSVLVFIHGGGFKSYTGNAQLFNGERLANKGDVILVTINYRLGALGFLVTGTTRIGATGNYAIADQRLALTWVRRNINRFGGNPNNVTIFGQSAGAISVGIHLTSHKADNLFSQAIMQSVPFSIRFKTLNQAIQQGRQFAANLNCSLSDIYCLRRKSPMEIIDAQKRTTISFGFLQRFLLWGPHLDGNEVPIDLIPGFETGIFYDKPVILGNTADEGIGYIYGAFRNQLSRNAFAAILMAAMPRYASEILSRYYPRRVSDARNEFAELATDFVFICPCRRAAKSLMQYTNVWMYVFDHDLNFLNETRYFPFCINSACHGSELPYLFQTAHRGGFELNFEDMQLSDEMLIYWTNFAKFGNPNGDQSIIDGEPPPEPRWPRYRIGQGQLFPSMVFRQPQSAIENEYHGVVCEALDRTHYLAN